jgi:hypothetical protein
VDLELAQWWDRFMNADEEARAAMLLPDKGGGKRRRRRRRPARSGERAEDATEGAQDDTQDAGEVPADGVA